MFTCRGRHEKMAAYWVAADGEDEAPYGPLLPPSTGGCRRPCSGARRCCPWLSRRGGQRRTSLYGSLHECELTGGAVRRAPQGDQDLVEVAEAHLRREGAGTMTARQGERLDIGDDAHVLSSTSIRWEMRERGGRRGLHHASICLGKERIKHAEEEGADVSTTPPSALGRRG